MREIYLVDYKDLTYAFSDPGEAADLAIAAMKEFTHNRKRVKQIFSNLKGFDIYNVVDIDKNWVSYQLFNQDIWNVIVVSCDLPEGDHLEVKLKKAIVKE